MSELFARRHIGIVPTTEGFRSERRHARRVSAKFSARVRPFYEAPESSEEISATVNLSRDGIYFETLRTSYKVDTHVYVACPCSTAGADREGESARVVRVEQSADGRYGVAVHFLRSAGFYRPGAAASTKERSE